VRTGKHFVLAGGRCPGRALGDGNRLTTKQLIRRPVSRWSSRAGVDLVLSPNGKSSTSRPTTASSSSMPRAGDPAETRTRKGWRFVPRLRAQARRLPAVRHYFADSVLKCWWRRRYGVCGSSFRHPAPDKGKSAPCGLALSPDGSSPSSASPGQHGGCSGTRSARCTANPRASHLTTSC